MLNDTIGIKQAKFRLWKMSERMTNFFQQMNCKKKKKEKPQIKTLNTITNEKENYRLKNDSKDFKPVLTCRLYQDPD